MNRLPERFEKEVLEPARIFGNNGFLDHGEYIKQVIAYDTAFSRGISSIESKIIVTNYEIAARGLEAMMENDELDLKFTDGYMFEYCIHTENAMYQDKDFLECIFKAIREIYK